MRRVLLRNRDPVPAVDRPDRKIQPAYEWMLNICPPSD
jgi:hypothetical protein